MNLDSLRTIKTTKQTAKTVQLSAETRSKKFKTITKKEMNEIRRSMEGMKAVNNLQVSLRQ